MLNLFLLYHLVKRYIFLNHPIREVLLSLDEGAVLTKGRVLTVVDVWPRVIIYGDRL